MMSQSWIMMYAAGGAWQYGKRRISAMSNEEFNKLLPIDLLKEHTVMLRSAIPTIKQSILDMTPLIDTLMTQFGTFINEAIKAIPQTLSNILGTPGGEFSNIPTTGGQAGIGLPPPGTAAFLHYFAQLSKQTGLTPEQLQAGQLPEFENTQAKRLALQKIEDQRVAGIQRLLKAKAAAEERKDIRAIKPQFGRVEQARLQLGRKRPAGQSQRLEKAKLIKNIKHWIAMDRRLKGSGSTGRKIRQLLRQGQQSLANLLARYQF